MKFLICLFISFILCYQANADEDVNQCKVDSEGVCKFVDIYTSETYPSFEPTADKPNDVRSIVFENSRMYMLTDELCTAFPKVRSIDVQKMAIQKVAPGALDRCVSLKQIDFDGNQIKTLDVNLFAKTPNMEDLYLTNNELTRLDGKMFATTPNLELLYVQNNSLTEMRLQDFPTLNNLEKFKFESNHITELDEHKLIEKFPKLKEIGFGENLLDCGRLQIIKDFLATKNILDLGGMYSRKRKFKVTTDGKYTCLTDKQKQGMRNAH